MVNLSASSPHSRRATVLRRPVFAIIAIFIIAAVTVCIAFVLSRASSTSPSADSSSEVINDSASTDSSTTSSSTPTTNEDIKELPTPDGASANQFDYLTGNITSISKTDQFLNIRVGINQFLTDGTCELLLTSTTGPSYTQTTSILPDPSSSYCDGFDVPRSSLGSGAYQVIIKLTSGSRTGTIEGSTTL